jgi:hypothetical protein
MSCAAAAIVLFACCCSSSCWTSAAIKTPSSTRSTDAPLELLILKREGSILRQVTGNTGAAAEKIANVSGLETIDDAVVSQRLVATHGKDVLWISFDRRPPVALLRHESNVRFATISNDAKSLAFSADGGVWLAAAGADGKFADAKRIAPEFGYGPSFSSDGRVVYFEGNGGLKRFDRTTGAVEPFLPKYPRAHTVRCSRDGRFITFSSERALFVYRTDDQSVRKLTDGRAYDRFPSFAGDEIVFFRESAGGAGGVGGGLIRSAIGIRADGSNERELYRGDVELVCAKPRE